MFLNFNAFRRLMNPFKPTFTAVRNDVILKAIKAEGCKDYFITDAGYKAPAYFDIEPLFQCNSLKFIKYRADEYDCDDYARTASATLHILFGNITVGEAAIKLDSGVNHMVNFVVLSDGTVVYVEPQTNKLIKYKVIPYFMII